MIEPSIPDNETERLAELCALNILDTPPEPRFDRVTRLAQSLFQVPIALVSLIDGQRQWFKSRQGLAACETPRGISFCGHAILQDAPLVVDNALLDPRFIDNPLVSGEPYIRFYAGIPLRGPNGFRVGTLCLIDRQPRQLGAIQLNQLADLGEIAEEQLVHQQISSITALYRAEQQRLQSVLNAAAEGIIVIDEQGKIELINPAIERLFGYTASELLGQPVKILVPPSSYDYSLKFRAFMDRITQGDGQQMPGARKDGSTFPMELSVREMSYAGRTQFVTVLHDITERKAMERVKDEFISTVSHELRTPLTAIRGALGLVLRKSGEVLPEKLHKMLETASRNTERLNLLINDILDLEKIQAGHLALHRAPVDLVALAAQALTQHESYAEQHGVTFVLQGAAEPAMVLADEHRIMQVMANLLSNAAKFSPPGAAVEVLIQPAGPDRLRLAVQDHGRGIAAEFHDRIFGRFTQADASDSRAKGGSGLGLSICKALVEAHGGAIGFFPTPGQGTTFYFELPIYSDTAPTGASTTP